MKRPEQFLGPAAAARQLGVSPKALRLYEQRGLMTPARSAAGWRAYGPEEMVRGREIVALRRLGLSLMQIGKVLAGDRQSLAAALDAHRIALEGDVSQLAQRLEKLDNLRAGLARGDQPVSGELVKLLHPDREVYAAFDLPWPWGGERFELTDIRSLNYIIGPLGSGKTRLAKMIAGNLPNARFVDLERSGNSTPNASVLARAERACNWLAAAGAVLSAPLRALVTELVTDDAILVIDLVEQGLDQASQEALSAYLRQRRAGAPALFLMTRSSTMLDMGAVGPDETIILCPANHALPTYVAPYPGAPGYEAVVTCLATPEVRARTEGVIAVRQAKVAGI